MKHAWGIMMEVSCLLSQIKPEDINGIEWLRHKDEISKMKEKVNEIVSHVTGMHNGTSKSMQKRFDVCRPPRKIYDHPDEGTEGAM